MPASFPGSKGTKHYAQNSPEIYLAQYRTELLATSIRFRSLEGGEGLNRVLLIQI